MSERLDLIIAGGRVIDPSCGRDEICDVAVADGRVAGVGRIGEPDKANEVFDARGCIVCPGLVDMHTHVYWGASILSLDADEHAAERCTTTWVDAGTAGAANFSGFERFVIRPATVRIVPFLNVSGPGLPMGTRAHAAVADLDADLALEVVERYPGVIKGIKVLCSGPQTGASGLTPLRVARELADAAGLPLVCHIGSPPPGFAGIEPLLRPGDMVTHAYKGKTGCLLVAGGKIREEAWEARRRGVLFDVGHGQSSFSWVVARAALDQGFTPHTISTDLHAGCVNGPARGMPWVMSKFLHLGMELPEVVRLSTTRPAEFLGLAGEAGSLQQGACADIAVLEVEEGDVAAPDCEGVVETMRRRLRGRLAVRAGSILK